MHSIVCGSLNWTWGPFAFLNVSVWEKLFSYLHFTLFVASFTGLCALTWIHFFPTGFRIYDKKTVFRWTIKCSASKAVFSPIIYVQETMKTWDIRAFPLCEGWAGKRGPLSVHPSSQHKWKGGPCAEGISGKCVCEKDLKGWRPHE